MLLYFSYHNKVKTVVSNLLSLWKDVIPHNEHRCKLEF